MYIMLWTFHSHYYSCCVQAFWTQKSKSKSRSWRWWQNSLYLFFVQFFRISSLMSPALFSSFWIYVVIKGTILWPWQSGLLRLFVQVNLRQYERQAGHNPWMVAMVAAVSAPDCRVQWSLRHRTNPMITFFDTSIRLTCSWYPGL